MKTLSFVPTETYREFMGQLLVLYTQVDRPIMEICVERIASAPPSPLLKRGRLHLLSGRRLSQHLY